MGMIYELDAALRKQKPMKPVFSTAEYPAKLLCPSCGKTVKAIHQIDAPNYCQNCGQRLDWRTGDDER